MGRADDGGTGVVSQPREEPADRSRVRLVQASGGLVRQQDPRPPCEGAGDRDPLPLACREAVGAVVQTAPEADADKGFASVSLDAADEKAELDVLQGAQMEDEPRLLRHERDLPPPEVGRLRA